MNFGNNKPSAVPIINRKTSSSSPSSYSSSKWISSEELTDGSKTRSLVVHNTNSVFSSVSNNECNLISIFGRARQGKSTLMNCLAGENDIFRISNAKDSCTQGIDISDKWLDINEFSKIDGGTACKPSEHSIKIGFVDAEGQGDKDVSYDAKLVCPILLASKCVIFNWRGDLQKDHILSQLGIMTRAASNVNTTKSDTKKFGHLHIVFRDWQAVSADADATEGVYRDLFNQESSSSDGCAARNKIRIDILQAFDSLKIWLFDAPTDSVADLKKKLTITMTTPNFRAQIRKLRYVLSTQLRNPTLFGGKKSLVGKNFPPLIKAVVDSLNKGDVILPQAAYVNMMRTEIDHLRETLDVVMRERMEESLNQYQELVNDHNFPSEKDVMAIITRDLDTLIKKFNSDFEKLIGGLSGEQLSHVSADSQKRVLSTKENILKQFQSSYKLLFIRYLMNLRKQVEVKIEKMIHNDQENNHQKVLESTYNDNIKSYIGESLGISFHSGVEINDTFQQLCNFADNLIDKSRKLIQKLNEDKFIILQTKLDLAIEEMKTSISNNAMKLFKDHKTGFSIDLLEGVLNTRYQKVKKDLVLQAKNTGLEQKIEETFNKACESLQPFMTDIYVKLKNEAYTKVFQQALLREESELNKLGELDLSSYTISSLEHSIKHVENSTDEYISISLSGWFFEREKCHSNFNKLRNITSPYKLDLTRRVDEAAKEKLKLEKHRLHSIEEKYKRELAEKENLERENRKKELAKEEELSRIKLENEVLKENERQRKLDEELHRLQQAKKKQEEQEKEKERQLKLQQQQYDDDDDDDDEDKDEKVMIIDKISTKDMSFAAQKQRARQSAIDKGELKEVKKVGKKGKAKVEVGKKTFQQQREDGRKFIEAQGYLDHKVKRDRDEIVEEEVNDDEEEKEEFISKKRRGSLSPPVVKLAPGEQLKMAKLAEAEKVKAALAARIQEIQKNGLKNGKK